MLLGRNFEFMKTPRDSFLAVSDDCWQAHPTPSYTPSGASLNFAGCSCLCGAVAVRKSSADVQFGVDSCFLSHLVYPKFRPISTTAAPQSRGVRLC